MVFPVLHNLSESLLSPVLCGLRALTVMQPEKGQCWLWPAEGDRLPSVSRVQVSVQRVCHTKTQ